MLGVVPSVELGGGGAGCSSMRARRFAGITTPVIELRSPKGNSSRLEVILSCSACMITGGGGSTGSIPRAHCLSSQRCSFFFFAFLEGQMGGLHCFIVTCMRLLTSPLHLLHRWGRVIRLEACWYEGALPSYSVSAVAKIAQILPTIL